LLADLLIEVIRIQTRRTKLLRRCSYGCMYMGM